VRIRSAKLRGVHQARLQTQIEQAMMAENRTLFPSRSQDTVHDFTQKRRDQHGKWDRPPAKHDASMQSETL
jgi:hypothetical protein